VVEPRHDKSPRVPSEKTTIQQETCGTPDLTTSTNPTTITFKKAESISPSPRR